MISFFIMIYDSIRQAKPTIRNNFGVSRFNTRLNFYMFEINRLGFLQRKSFFNLRPNFNNLSQKSELNLLNLVNYETTLFSYKLYQKNK